MRETGHRRTLLRGLTLGVLLVLLALTSWRTHVAQLERQLGLEAAEAAHLADMLAWAAVTAADTPATPGPSSSLRGSGDDAPALAEVLRQRLPRPTGSFRLEDASGRVLLRQEPSPRSLGTVWGATRWPDPTGPTWLEHRSHAPIARLTGVSSASLDDVVASWLLEAGPVAALLLVTSGLLLTMSMRLDLVQGLLRQSRRHALEDALTGLPNRRAFDAAFDAMRRASARGRRPLSVLFIDIDHFKRFNDDHGHSTGDRALLAVVEAVRASLLRPSDVCSRWGGEEFVVLLPDTDAGGALQTARRIVERVRSVRMHGRGTRCLRVSVSIGIATHTGGSAPGPELLIHADHAMLEAKRGGRDRWSVWLPSLEPADATSERDRCQPR